MRKISVLNRFEFEKVMISNDITKENVHTKDKLYIISMVDSMGQYSTSYFDNVDSNNVLVTRFDDCDKTYDITLLDGNKTTCTTISDEQAQEIFDFIDSIPEESEIIIHCSAGQNRSGSVGKFATEFFEQDLDKFLFEHPVIKGNGTVTRLLNNIWLWGHYK